MQDNSQNSDTNDQIRNGNDSENREEVSPEKIPDETAMTRLDDNEDQNAESSDSSGNEDLSQSADTGEMPEDISDAQPLSKEQKTESNIPAFQPSPSKTKTPASNYQISLINEDILKIVVLTKQGVKINSSVKEKSTSAEIQSNEIYLYPKIDSGLQETEVFISIKSKDEKENESERVRSESPEEFLSKSNYVVNLINENLLRIKIETDRGVEVDSKVKDKRTGQQTQSNRIFLQPKLDNEIQEVEILIVIEPGQKGVLPDGNSDEESHMRFIPNPEVVDLIKPPDYSSLMPGGEYQEYQEYQNLEQDSQLSNPFDKVRKIIRKNLTIGIIAAVALHAIAAGVFYFSVSKKQKPQGQEELSRLIVIEDLPDPKLKIEVVEEQKPKPEETISADDELKKLEERKREIPPRKIMRPPDVSRPETKEDEKIDSLIQSGTERELDSLRKLLAVNTGDTVSADTSSAVTEDIPDSLKKIFSANAIGLSFENPNKWIVNDNYFFGGDTGVVVVDTLDGKNVLNIFIFLDPQGKEYKQDKYKTEFKMNDSSYTAFLQDPRTEAGFIKKNFYIFNKYGTEKLKLEATVRESFEQQYVNAIDSLVKSIKINKNKNVDEF